MRPPNRDLTVGAVLLAIVALGAVTGVAAQVAGGAPVIGKKCTKAGMQATTIKGVPLVCTRRRGKLVWAKRAASPRPLPAAPAKPPYSPPAAPSGGGSTGGSGGTGTSLGSDPLKPLPGKNAPGLAPGVGVITDAGRVAVQLSSAVAQGIDVDPATGLVYIGTSAGVSGWCGPASGTRADRLAVVDPDTAREIASVASGRSPIWPRVSGSTVWLAESGGTLGYHSLSGTRLGAVAVGGLPHDVAVDAATGLAFVSNTNDGSQEYMTVVRTSDHGIVRHVAVQRFPHRYAQDATRHRAWLVSVETGILNVIDTTTGTLLAKWDTGGGAGLGYSPARSRLYVSAREAGGTPTHSARVIDATSGALVGTIGPFFNQGGYPPQHMAVDDGRGLLFITLNGTRYVGVADLETLRPLAVFEAASCPFAIALDVSRGRGYVTSALDPEVVMFDLTKVARALGR